MKPKEKANELVNSFVKLYYHQTENYLELDEAKQCALIAVNEIINSWDIDLYKDCGSSIYWQEVKQEINKL
jgi:hypothetical protein